MFLLDGTEIQFCVHQHSCFGITETDLTCCVWGSANSGLVSLQQEGPGSWVEGATVNKVNLLGSLKEEDS